MPVTRRLWRIPSAGSLDRLTLVAETLPDPGPGEARLRVEAVGLNFADIFACQGLYSATPSGAFTPGLECAGVIEALGPPRPGDPPTALAVGDRVAVLTRFGGYATALNFDLRYALPFPGGWSAAEAAAWPVQALTAWYGLVPLGGLRTGQCVLVQSAAGGVGLQALSMIDSLGARAIAAVGSEDKRLFLVARRGLDPAAVIVRDRRRFGDQLDAALAAARAPGLDLVLDAVLGPFFRPAFDRLAPEGRYVLFGAADFMGDGARPNYLSLAWRWLRRPRLDPLAMISANRSCMAFNLIWLWNAVERVPAAVQAIRALLGEPPLVGERLPFEQAPQALRRLQSGRTVGKVVLDVRP
jgi:alcohol dehydrogenase